MFHPVQAPIVVHNLHGGPEKDKKRRRRTIRMFLHAAKHGVGGFNELAKRDRRYIKAEAAKRGLRIFIYGDNGVVWDPALLEARKPRIKKIMTGGHVGADGVATAKKGDDDRRVGPNRYAIYIPFKVIAHGLTFEFVVTHAMAKSFTTARWRIRLFRKSIRSLADDIRKASGLLVGDLNSKEYVNLPDVLDVPVHTPPTFGKSRYDQILRWGPDIAVSKVNAVETPSDHDMLVGTVTFYRGPTPRR